MSHHSAVSDACMRIQGVIQTIVPRLQNKLVLTRIQEMCHSIVQTCISIQRSLPPFSAKKNASSRKVSSEKLPVVVLMDSFDDEVRRKPIIHGKYIFYAKKIPEQFNYQRTGNYLLGDFLKNQKGVFVYVLPHFVVDNLSALRHDDFTPKSDAKKKMFYIIQNSEERPHALENVIFIDKEKVLVIKFDKIARKLDEIDPSFFHAPLPEDNPDEEEELSDQPLSLTPSLSNPNSSAVRLPETLASSRPPAPNSTYYGYGSTSSSTLVPLSDSLTSHPSRQEPSSRQIFLVCDDVFLHAALSFQSCREFEFSILSIPKVQFKDGNFDLENFLKSQLPGKIYLILFSTLFLDDWKFLDFSNTPANFEDEKIIYLVKAENEKHNQRIVLQLDSFTFRDHFTLEEQQLICQKLKTIQTTRSFPARMLSSRNPKTLLPLPTTTISTIPTIPTNNSQRKIPSPNVLQTDILVIYDDSTPKRYLQLFSSPCNSFRFTLIQIPETYKNKLTTKYRLDLFLKTLEKDATLLIVMESIDYVSFDSGQRTPISERQQTILYLHAAFRKKYVKQKLDHIVWVDDDDKKPLCLQDICDEMKLVLTNLQTKEE